MFSVCIVRRGTVGVSVMQMIVYCVHPECCVLHNLQFVNAAYAGHGYKRRPYGGGILQSRPHDCLIGNHECLLLFTTSCCCECFYHL